MVDERLIKGKSYRTITLPHEIIFLRQFPGARNASAQLPHVHLLAEAAFQKTYFTHPSCKREMDIIHFIIVQRVLQFGESNAVAATRKIFWIQPYDGGINAHVGDLETHIVESAQTGAIDIIDIRRPLPQALSKTIDEYLFIINGFIVHFFVGRIHEPETVAMFQRFICKWLLVL